MCKTIPAPVSPLRRLVLAWRIFAAPRFVNRRPVSASRAWQSAAHYA